MNGITFQPSSTSARLLLRKEFLESSSALLVGIVIFVILPSIWTVVLAAIDPHYGIAPGIASMLWLLAAWLFTAVLGAQVVCRDLGTPLERFLLARPVTETQVLRAKARTGFVLVLLISLAIGLLELLWAQLSPTHRSSPLSDFAGAYFLATALSICAYWLAFAAACITRRSLVSTLVAAFAIVVMMTAPLVVRIPGLPDTYSFVHDARSNAAGVVLMFFLLCVASWLVALIARRVFASAERRIEIGARHLACIATMTLVILFVLAMREVGASQPLSATWWGSENTKFDDNYYGRFAAGPLKVAIAPTDNTVHLIDLSPDGIIVRTRKLDWVQAEAMIQYKEKHPSAHWAMNENGTLASVRQDYTQTSKEGIVTHGRVWLRLMEWETASVSNALELPWPQDRPRPKSYSIHDIYLRGTSLVVLGSEFVDQKKHTDLIIVYSVKDEIITPLKFAPFHGGHGVRRIAPVYPTGAANPSADLLSIDGFMDGLILAVNLDAPADEFSRTVGYIRIDPAIEYFPRSYKFGLSVVPNVLSRTKRPVDSEGVIGRYHASPWSLLFRERNPHLIPAGPNRWVEVHFKQVFVYDLSNPKRPQRIGTVTGPFCWQAHVAGDLLFLNLDTGFAVARLPTIGGN
jgi:ABC-type transport system involved in multi-copper enzyme maturation permease subunit